MVNLKNGLQYPVKNPHFQRIGAMKSNSFVLGFTIGALLRVRNPLSLKFRFLDRQKKFSESKIVNEILPKNAQLYTIPRQQIRRELSFPLSSAS